MGGGGGKRGFTTNSILIVKREKELKKDKKRIVAIHVSNNSIEELKTSSVGLSLCHKMRTQSSCINCMALIMMDTYYVYKFKSNTIRKDYCGLYKTFWDYTKGGLVETKPNQVGMGDAVTIDNEPTRHGHQDRNKNQKQT